MKQAIVIGSGAGGAMMAKELQGSFQVTILEAGDEFQPFTFSIDKLAGLRKTGLFLDERMISMLFPAMRVQKAASDMVLVHGRCTGGTTTLATGSALRCDEGLLKIGIQLDEEFEELAQEIPLSTDHEKYWSSQTKTLFDACAQLGFKPTPTAKLVDFDRCVHCGRCVLGCCTGAKWDSRRLLAESIEKGAVLKTSCKVTKLGIDCSNNTVHAVYAKEGRKQMAYSADLVVLAAGGLGTPIILERSGITCEAALFVDPVLCVAAPYPGAGQDCHIPMPFIMQRDGYMLSPYMDYLSFFFNKSWRMPSSDMLSMMVKLSDASFGISRTRKVEKELTLTDQERLKAGVSDCKTILRKMGVAEGDMFLGTLNAGHPGGMLPLTSEEQKSFHNRRLPENLYIADATLLPESMGNPPIWTILALAKRIAKVCMAAAVDL
ncbi:MAG: GMC family oxidoreductase N-terminal domain-containing protein [Clostridiaceae bacterium]|nr:GMC family oxidoreductase N-terminal domain-containing protein [Clostridiaceae bacterium]